MMIANWYTLDTPYEELAKKNAETFRVAGAEPKSFGFPTTSSWLNNCNQKPNVCLEIINTLEKNQGMLLLDADAEVLKPFSVDHLKDSYFAYVLHTRKSGAQEVLSGTLYITNTPECRGLLNRWRDECDKYPEKWDQRSLQQIIGMTPPRVDGGPMSQKSMSELSKQFAYIQGIDDPKDEANSYIRHNQASRELKESIGIPNPAKHEGMVWNPRLEAYMVSSGRKMHDHVWLIPVGPNHDPDTTLNMIGWEDRVIIINDGSSFDEAKYEKCKTIRIVKTEKPGSGCAHALNVGLAAMTDAFEAGWVYRMDADDWPISDTHRNKWADEAPSNVVVVAGNCVCMDGRLFECKGETPDQIREKIRKRINPIYHPATCIRTSALLKVGGWPEKFGEAEDYALWTKLLEIGDIQPIKENWTMYNFVSDPRRSKKRMKQMYTAAKAAYGRVQKLSSFDS